MSSSAAGWSGWGCGGFGGPGRLWGRVGAAEERGPVDLGRLGVVVALPDTVRAVVGHRVVQRLVLIHPREHAAHVLGVVPVAEQTPFRIRDGLLVGLGEVHVFLEAVGLFDLFVERQSGGLVVGVHPDDVDRVVTRITLRPGNGVPAAGRREVEPEFLPRHGPHRGDDSVPVLLPGLRVGPAPMGVRDAVHLPAEHDDRVRHLQLDEPLGELAEVVIELSGRALPQQLPDFGVGDVVLVALQHGHVEDEHPVVLLPPPVRPHVEEAGGALDVAPAVAGQIGVAHAQLGVAQPAAELGDPGHAAGAVVEVGAEDGAVVALLGCRGFFGGRSGGTGRVGRDRRGEGRRGHRG